MRILLLNDYGVPMGGAEVLSFALRDELRKRGHDARLMTTTAAEMGAKGCEEEHEADYRCFGSISRYRTLLQTANVWAYRALQQVLREFRPDVVHVRMFLTQLSPLILPLLKSVPSVYHVVWYRPVCPVGTKLLPNGQPCRVSPGAACYKNRCLPLRDWMPLMIQMSLWRRWRGVFARIIANSEATKAALVAEGIQPVQVILNGVPVQKSKAGLAGDPMVVYAGRLTREKGVDVLLRAFKSVRNKVPNAQLLIAGSGREEEALRTLVQGLGLGNAVSMSGHLTRNELETRAREAWVQVVPSRWAEPFGLVAVEAMMRGRAVVASATGGLQEIVEQGRTGFLVPPDNAEALAEKLLVLLLDRRLAETMGEAARGVAQVRWSLARQVEEFVAVYEQLVAGPSIVAAL
ncbi:MAG: glycosyltransferase family 4 protein [Nitrospirota bacterium]|nr:glycosyltransferase family 4 protein [Nitrospirota bacterium]MDH4361344.1 glycosyltransferase family 4 protein [Nitrospirota bacterium]MDH5296379.1 glycosyltransferase family 4 protein [Nitrospirota bacterium]